MNSFALRFLFLLALLGFGAMAAPAQDDAIRNRMAQRLPAIDALKDRGTVGENNRGFLEPRGQLAGADQQVVSDENSDRRAVYAELAKKTGTTPEVVGRQRAQQIAIRSKRGVWIQDPNGQWRQK